MVVAVGGLVIAIGNVAAATPGPARQASMPGAALSGEARTLQHWVTQVHDNDRVPYAVIDKRQARIWLFDAQGRVLGSSPVLLGLARGDDSVPGIGERPIEKIKPKERTTPAGRFVVEAGRNASGEDIYWVDYDAAVSMHRVRATNPKERRLQRLATPTPADNRISYGCINVPAAFYNRVIQPTFGQAKALVYVLPETRPVQTLLKSRA